VSLAPPLQNGDKEKGRQAFLPFSISSKNAVWAKQQKAQSASAELARLNSRESK
jgi:hypothetical protein